MRKWVLITTLLLFAQASWAQKTDVRVICSNGIKGAIEKLLPEYERSSGNHVTIQYGASAVLKRTIEGGEAFDLVILTPAVIGDLVKQGKLASNSVKDISKSDLGVGVRPGTAKADISTPDAFKKRLLSAKSISYAKEGAATPVIDKMLATLGIAEAVKSKTLLETVSGRPEENVVEGKSELVFAPISEIVPVHGLKVLGLFPAPFQSPLVMTGAVGAQARNAAAAKGLMDFLMSAKAASAIKASGMTPVSK